MRRFSKKKIIYYSLTLLVVLFMIGLGIYQNVSYRVAERVEEQNNETVFQSILNTDTEENQKSYLDIDLSKDLSRPSDEYWTTLIQDGKEELYEENNYRSVYLNLKISNNTSKMVEDYRIRMDVNASTYFFKGWCGTFEFHQFRDGKELTQVIDFNAMPETYSLDVYEHQENPEDPTQIVYLFPLNPGDYVVYIPSKVDYFAPLTAGTVVTPGMIVYESIKHDPVSFTAYDENSIETSLSAIIKQQNQIALTISSRNDSWTKIIDDDGSGISEPNYIGQTYDLTFKNTSGSTINQYTLCFKAGDDMYLSSGWNGSFEIHQIRGNEEKVAYIEDLRNIGSKGLEIETTVAGEDTLIYLKKGDFFYYYPSEEKLEVPLNNGSSITAGVIIYQKIGKVITNSETTIYFHLYKNIIKEPLFVVGFGFGIVWLIILMFDIILGIRLRKFEFQKEKDEKIIVESIETFTGFIDARDPYTNGHSRRVADYTRLLAEQLGFSEEEQKRIYYIGLMHDCGKIGIPDSILGKPARLTDDEYEIIKRHPQKGYEILKEFTSIEGIREGVLYHHERFDGKGYPKGLKGEEIPLDARILCVADSVDAMNSDRCYRKRLSKDQILTELENNRGTQFDPEIAKVMEYLILSGKIETRQ